MKTRANAQRSGIITQYAFSRQSIWPNWAKRKKEEWTSSVYRTAFLHNLLHSALLVDLELNCFYLVVKTLMYWGKSCINQPIFSFFWHSHSFVNYILTDSYYRNIHCSRINWFYFSVSLTQQNNLRQLNILWLWLTHSWRLCPRYPIILIILNSKYREDLKYSLNERLMGSKIKIN